MTTCNRIHQYKRANGEIKTILQILNKFGQTFHQLEMAINTDHKPYFCSVFGIFLALLIFVSVSLASPQITFSRNWLRGRYPSDDNKVQEEDLASSEFKRVGKSQSPKTSLVREHTEPAWDLEYYGSIPMSGQWIMKVLERMGHHGDGRTETGSSPRNNYFQRQQSSVPIYTYDLN